MVLFYHRVADTFPNAWTIGCQRFAEQIDWLQRHLEIVSLAEVCARLRSGINRHPAVCITFDDGYADNADFAIPLLVERRIPCTYFVATDHVLNGRPFPHDLERGRPLSPNSPEQIIQFAQQGIEIGAHTRRHVDLGQVTDDTRLQDEMRGSAIDLQQLTGQFPRFFAFPYGQPSNFTAQAIDLARRIGFQAVCSAHGGYNIPGHNAFVVQRIHGDPEMVRFRNWLTGDPRKHRMNPPGKFDTASSVGCGT
jgi:peptidoglycan/xylan/chitin deacetylase (PgdA/CDA1 family)